LPARASQARPGGFKECRCMHLPAPHELKSQAGRALVRAVAAIARSQMSGGNWGYPEEIAEELWPRDEACAQLVRAASKPATTDTVGWADSLAAHATAAFLVNLGPNSVGSQLLGRGLQLDFTGVNLVVVPGIVTAPTTAFVQQGAPIPVQQFAFDGPALEPKKFAIITALTEEMLAGSALNIEKIVGDALSQSTALSLDSRAVRRRRYHRGPARRSSLRRTCDRRECERRFERSFGRRLHRARRRGCAGRRKCSDLFDHRTDHGGPTALALSCCAVAFRSFRVIPGCRRSADRGRRQLLGLGGGPGANDLDFDRGCAADGRRPDYADC
jgi:hypothetical protein